MFRIFPKVFVIFITRIWKVGIFFLKFKSIKIETFLNHLKTNLNKIRKKNSRWIKKRDSKKRSTAGHVHFALIVNFINFAIKREFHSFPFMKASCMCVREREMQAHNNMFTAGRRWKAIHFQYMKMYVEWSLHLYLHSNSNYPLCEFFEQCHLWKSNIYIKI